MPDIIEHDGGNADEVYDLFQDYLAEFEGDMTG